MKATPKPVAPKAADIEAAEREVERFRNLLINATRTLNDLRSRKAIAECRFQVGDVVRYTRATHDRAIDGKTFRVTCVEAKQGAVGYYIDVWAKVLTPKGVRGNVFDISGDGWEKVTP